MFGYPRPKNLPALEAVRRFILFRIVLQLAGNFNNHRRRTQSRNRTSF